MKRIALLMMAILLMVVTAFSQIINIPSDFSSIQAGIDAAAEGDTVLVAENTYFENINFLGKAIIVASLFILDGDTSHISNTIIDGSQSPNPDSASTVTMWSGEDTTSVLMGFTITGGKGTLLLVEGYSDYYGGGIVIEKSGGKILHNIIEENHIAIPTDTPLVLGGGIGGNVYGNHTLVIRNNTIRRNSVNGNWVYGAGISIVGGRLIIEGNSITDNTMIGRGADAGGGIFWASYLEGEIEEVIIRNNVIDSNKGSVVDDWVGGGGIYTGLTFETGIHIYNNVISNNSCGGRGGGIFNWANNMIVYNNTIINNQADFGGNTVYSMSGDVVFFNNILWSGVENDQADYLFNEEQTDMQWVHYNLLRKPFGPDDPVSSGHNMYLEPSFIIDSYEPSDLSPVIGRGVDSLECNGNWYHAPANDIKGNERPNGVDDFIDIGAHESDFDRSLLPNAGLVALGFQGYTLSPGFHSDSLKYLLVVPDTFSSVSDLQAIPADWLAETAFNHAADILSQNLEDRTTNITVTSSDGTSQKTYKVEFNPLSTDATLMELSVSQGTLDPDFDPGTLNYMVSLPAGTTITPTISYSTSNQGASVVIKDAVDVSSSITADKTSSIEVTAEFGEPKITYRIVFTVKTNTGINGNDRTGLSIYPNPTRDAVVIQTGIVGFYSVEIKSLNGQLLRTERMEGTTHQLDLSSFQNGVYFITITSKDYRTTRKIVKH